MKGYGKRGSNLAALLLAAAMLLSLLSACAGGKTDDPGGEPAAQNGGSSGQPPEQSKEEPPLDLTIMVPAFNTELPGEDSPVLKALEAYTNTNITMQFVPNSSYPDKMNITLASGQLPHIMVADRASASFINAARNGAFWELGPYLKDYPNLSQANPIVLNNSSIDGKTYGIYRGRVLGRMGVTLNADWMKKLRLELPKTIDEFYNILKAFKEDDPDGNGKDDTYGIVVTKYAGPWDIMQVWFGAPNKWGEGADGRLVPTHMTPEYKEALKFFRKLYEEGLVNEDFAVMDSAVWNDPFVNGQAGAFVDVADNARRLDGAMQEKYGKRDEPYTAVYQAPAGPKGQRDMPTSGYSGVLAVSKSAVKNEEQLKRVLDFLDKLNDVEMQTLLSYGVEGRHYEMNGDYIKVLTTPDNVGLVSELESMNQMLMFIGPEMPTLEPTAINTMVDEVQKANEAIVVANPAEPLISEVYAQKGQQLDNIVADARIKYIVGQIDDQGLLDAENLWLKSGGQEYIDEINKLYEAAKQ
ncbi:ABC transporter substrate-binding protein [Paenibacillus sp. 32O-W]|uniref:extracellular solute-binding protein n=1 Tax=Paenibacillus sp. 32O-W TaxID=1695218 RepID=UPI0007213F3F|nr:extracellular solute-binding protein [Paenibacillus sp. 32O-W]ALS27227.1 ABC transporter substrate-binding protein [Paenibacillus sp. 32O-W]